MTEASRFYLHLKELYASGPTYVPRRRASSAAVVASSGSQPFGAGRDPHGLGGVLDSLTDELGWNAVLAESDVVAGWADLVGPEIARHSTPIDLATGVLTVKCDSTGWATQLRFMRGELLERTRREHPRAGVESIRFIGPDVPSWKRGSRSVPGRGPRDTYG